MNTTPPNSQRTFMQFQIRLAQRVFRLYRAVGQKGADTAFFAKNAKKIRERWDSGQYAKFVTE